MENRELHTYLVSAPRARKHSPLPARRGVTGSETAFAQAVFGIDQWPASLTRSQLLAIDPLNVKVSVQLPLWSNEVNKPLEWVAKQPLDNAILTFANNRVANALLAYNANESISTLSLAVAAIDEVTKDPSNPGAPCPYLYRKTPIDFRKCFDARVYASMLSAQYMLRRGIFSFIDSRVHNLWWDVGFVALQSGQQSAVPKTEDPTNQQERWFYLGWMFDPGTVPSIYTSGSLRSRSKPKQATFVAERSLVARAPNTWSEDVNVYTDFLEVATSVPSSWAYNAVTFALTELLRRLHAGDRPPAIELATARTKVTLGMSRVTAKVTSGEMATLQSLANQVLGLL